MRRGGLGLVSVARDARLPREVAFKEIKPGRATDGTAAGQFVVEAEVTGALEHPGIPPVYDLGQYADGRPFYAMRFIRGTSLTTELKRFHELQEGQSTSVKWDGAKLVEMRKLLQKFVSVCEAIQYAHDRGVIHRDLKPDNIMLGRYGETLVVDWGLAKIVGSVARRVTAFCIDHRKW
jgi:serine/threonine protein kinase